MSGIVGIYNVDSRPILRDEVNAMSASIAHRGPDENGIWINGAVGFGHRQLWTTPESLNEHQPIVIDDANYAITCDGRIDNREDLIATLGSEHRVDDNITDAELILRAYITWGVDSLSHLVGDFAFAIWDKRQERLLCARDASGVKFLYYHFDGRRFVFGSEIKALFSASGIPREINGNKVGFWLNGSFGDAEQTFFKNIYTIPAGYYLLITKEGMVKRPFWNPDPSDQIVYDNDDEYVEQFAFLFNQAVKSRMRTIGPVGVQLSGGLDSSSVMCVAEELQRAGVTSAPDLKFFSAVFPGGGIMDESQYVHDIVDKYGTHGHMVPSDKLWALKGLEDPKIQRDAPYVAPTETWEKALLAKASQEGVRTLLTGEGGDQLLFAWEPYIIDLLRAGRIRAFRNQWRYLNSWAKRSVRRKFVQNLVPWQVQRLHTRMKGKELYSWIDEGFSKRIGLQNMLMDVDYKPQHRSPYLQEQQLIVEARGRHVGYVCIDMKSAEYAMDLRHPFWDVRLMEFLMKTPARQKYSTGQTKLILRRAMNGILPDSIVNRRDKANFDTLIDRGVENMELARISETLENPMISRMGFVNVTKLREALDNYHTATPVEKSGIYIAFTLERWLQNTLAGNGGEDKVTQVATPN